MAKCSACGGTGKSKPKGSNPNMPRKPEDSEHEKSMYAKTKKPGKEQNKLEKSNERMRAKHDATSEKNKKKKYGY